MGFSICCESYEKICIPGNRLLKRLNLALIDLKEKGLRGLKTWQGPKFLPESS